MGEGCVGRRDGRPNRKDTPHLNRTGRQLGGRDMAYLAHYPGI